MTQYDKDRDEMIRRALDAGVSMICVGMDLETSKQAIELAQKYPNIWASVGLHPNDVINELRITDYELLMKDDGVVAIGEVGLDYYRTSESEKQKKQKEVFEQFIDLGIKCKKPLIFHFRDSQKGSMGHVHKDALEILNSQSGIRNNLIGAVAHSFTGNINDARKYLDLGFYLGFNGILTFPPSRKASEGQAPGMYDEVVKYIPLDRILLETDAPFLSPEPYRGKRNEPAYVVEVAKKVAQLKGEPLEKVIEQTTQNCKKLFQIQ
ncbi:MAG: TatD family hydrolase [Candidatus Yanofskybacteria bacterium]|nr:TatD family hydrolase [Candidatus Yanofskybacteria bacterium]